MHVSCMRYVRRTPLSIQVDIEDPLLAEEVGWLTELDKNRFYQIHDETNISNSHMHKSGHIVGMDAASAASVWALDVRPGMAVLDTCSAPGMKYMLLWDRVGELGSVTGLDVSEQRLDVAKNLLRKNGYAGKEKFMYLMPIEWEVLERADCWVSSAGGVRFEEFALKRKRQRPPKKKKVKLDFVHAPVNLVPIAFDRVLVDAECTHDGSVRHTSKHDESTGFWSKHTKNEKNRVHFDSDDKMHALIQTQRRLIRNGFTLLKSGGLMVYSTCSLQPKQNQEIVDWLFAEMGEKAVPASLPFDYSSVPATRLSDSSCLFDPEVSGTSGQFISLIRKV